MEKQGSITIDTSNIPNDFLLKISKLKGVDMLREIFRVAPPLFTTSDKDSE